MRAVQLFSGGWGKRMSSKTTSAVPTHKPQSRMIRKLVREIFGHYATPTDCYVFLPLIPEKGYPVTVFVPNGDLVDTTSLKLSYPIREATLEEENDMQTFYVSRIRIDSRLASYTHIPCEVHSDHVQFGEFGVKKS